MVELMIFYVMPLSYGRFIIKSAYTPVRESSMFFVSRAQSLSSPKVSPKDGEWARDTKNIEDEA